MISWCVPIGCSKRSSERRPGESLELRRSHIQAVEGTFTRFGITFVFHSERRFQIKMKTSHERMDLQFGHLPDDLGRELTWFKARHGVRDWDLSSSGQTLP
jgi:hypothetical protein